MERLTQKHYGADDYYMVCSGTCSKEEFRCEDCPETEKIVNKLGAYEDMGLEPEIANEAAMMFSSDEANHHDKAVFVQNLGWLLRQTREQVEHCFLDEQEVVHILFRGGHEKRVNVRGNSYAAVIREVAAAL